MFENSLLKFLYGFELCPYVNVIYPLTSINISQYPEHQLFKTWQINARNYGQ